MNFTKLEIGKWAPVKSNIVVPYKWLSDGNLEDKQKILVP